MINFITSEFYFNLRRKLTSVDLQAALERAKMKDLSEMPHFIKILSQEHNITMDNVTAASELIDEYCLWLKFREKDNDIRQALCLAFVRPLTEIDPAFLAEQEQNLCSLWAKLITLEYQLTAEFNEMQERFGFHYFQTNSQPVLEEYENIGRALQDSQTILEFKHVAKQVVLESVKYPQKAVPSFAVCGSSGTGKTQLPFSLDIPLLYFSGNPSSQPICREFQEISWHLNRILIADFETFIESSRISSPTIEDFSPLKILSSTDLFLIPAFLVNLIKCMFQLKAANPKLLWPRLQTMIQERIPAETMKINTARYKLLEIADMNSAELQGLEFSETKNVTVFDPQEKKQYLRLPLVFLNEFKNTTDLPNRERFENTFLRNIISTCLLVPVLMSSNPNIAELVSERSAIDASTNIWAYVFYKFPSYPEMLLARKLDQLLPNNDELRNLMFELLKNERPLFVESVFQQIQQLNSVRAITKTNEAFVDWFDQILKNIQDAFFERKEFHLDRFFAHQIEFLEYAFQKKNKKGKNIQNLSNAYGHLAHIQVPEDCVNCTELPEWPQPRLASENSFFELYGDSSVPYYKISTTTHVFFQKYTATCLFNTFDQTPLSCMALTRSRTFRKEKGNYTAFSAVINTFKRNSLRTISGKSKRKSKGCPLDQIANLAFLNSTHAGGITGMKFKDWIRYFVPQLACYPESEPNDRWIASEPAPAPHQIDLGLRFSHSNAIITYSCFNCSNWPRKFYQFLQARQIQVQSFSSTFWRSNDIRGTWIEIPPEEIVKGDFSHLESSVPHHTIFSSNSKSISPKAQEVDIDSNDLSQSEALSKLITIECKLGNEILEKEDLLKIVSSLKTQGKEGKINLVIAYKVSSEFTPRLAEHGPTTRERSKKRRVTLEFPFKDIDIYSLKRRHPAIMLTNSLNGKFCTVPLGYYFLESVYITGSQELPAEKVYILIDLSEIHGEYI